MPNTLVSEFPIDYREACFYAWYRAGRPSLVATMKIIPSAPDGRRPHRLTVKSWMEGGNDTQAWHDHADVLDAELTLRLDKEAIEERAALVRQLAQDGQLIKEAGIAFLKGNEPFKDNPSAAVRAVVAGADMQFKYSGMAASLVAIAQMNDKQLEKEMMRLLGKNENDTTVVEGEEVPSDDDSTSEDSND